MYATRATLIQNMIHSKLLGTKRAYWKHITRQNSRVISAAMNYSVLIQVDKTYKLYCTLNAVTKLKFLLIAAH